MNTKIETLSDLIHIIDVVSNETDKQLKEVISTMDREELELYLLRMTYLASMIKIDE
jgi:hypothetical protein